LSDESRLSEIFTLPSYDYMFYSVFSDGPVIISTFLCSYFLFSAAVCDFWVGILGSRTDGVVRLIFCFFCSASDDLVTGIILATGF
jgi:hypothetical protein